jgi:Tfp pilus assembly protein PilF
MKFLAILLCSLLTACAGPQRDRAPLAPLFQDAGFQPPSTPVGAAHLFDLSPEMRAYLHSAGFTMALRRKGYDRGLVDALYAKGELKIEYDSTMTRTAAETYAARAGNCLSLVIMTAAFAKELGMPVRYQSVEVDQSWSRNAGLYLVSSHVNLSLGSRGGDPLRGWDAGRLLTIDFLPPEDAARYRSNAIDEDEIVAMYMNNRAAESLVQGRLDDAYWWARAAVAREPSSVIAYNTLGVVYQRHGDALLAERVYRAALRREPDNLVVMENLQPLLASLGKADEARALASRLARLEPHPPFQFFDQGMKALQGGDYQAAKALFAREVMRAPYYDEFHFWLAIACLRLGDAGQAREQLALALDTSTRHDSRDLYSAKLAHLRALGARLPD